MHFQAFPPGYCRYRKAVSFPYFGDNPFPPMIANGLLTRAVLRTGPGYWSRHSQRNHLSSQMPSWVPSFLGDSLQATGCCFSLTREGGCFWTPGGFMGLCKFKVPKGINPSKPYLKSQDSTATFLGLWILHRRRFELWILAPFNCTTLQIKAWARFSAVCLWATGCVGFSKAGCRLSGSYRLPWVDGWLS